MWQTLSTLSTSLRGATSTATDTATPATCNCSSENAEMHSHKVGNMLPSTDNASAAMRRCRCRTKINSSGSSSSNNSNRNNSNSNNSCSYGSNILQWLLLLCLFCDFSEAALRDVNLLVEPPAVRRGQSATLRCDYQLDGAPLYSIKFYRGQMEFYRYTPGEYPHTKVFPYPGLRVDENSSNATMVHIRNVSFGLSGLFSCEVTADAPLWSTTVAFAQMQVVEYPEKRPQLFTDNTRYEPGDVLRANCSTLPSRPRAELRFTINNVPVDTEKTQYIRSDDLYASRLSLKLQLQAVHFVAGSSAHGNGNGNGNGHGNSNVLTNALQIAGGSGGGGLVLRCTAQIGDFYQEYKEIELGTPQKDPVPARVTLSSGTGLRGFLETYFVKSSARSIWRGAAGSAMAGLMAMILTRLINGS